MFYLWFFFFKFSRYDFLPKLFQSVHEFQEAWFSLKHTFLIIFCCLNDRTVPRVKLANCKSALKLPKVYSTDHAKAVVRVLVLLFGALWFILRGDLLYILPCAILFLVFFSPFSIQITSLGEERAILSAFCMFDQFVLVWICRFPRPLDVWEGLRFVIVLLPFLYYEYKNICQ